MALPDYSESNTAALSLVDIIALNDAELAELMKNHRHPNGNIELHVDGLDKVSEHERTAFTQRIV